MFKKIMLGAALLAFAAGGASAARAGQDDASPTSPIVGQAAPAGEPAALPGGREVTPEFLTSVVNWLAGNFGLPASHDHPRIEFASPMKLVSMRYKGVLPEAWREDAIRDPSVQAAHHREVVAVYNDTTRTIFLPQGWTGATAADRSILAHEMVHHLQNLGGLRYECPAAREKIAYEAQREWLRLAGRDLEAEFGIDMLTLLVSSACMG